MSIAVTLQATYTTTGFHRSAVFRLVELLLRKWRKQQSQSFNLLRIEQAFEDFVVVVDRKKFALRHITALRMCGQKYRRGKLWQKVIGYIIFQIKSIEISFLLSFDGIYMELRK